MRVPPSDPDQRTTAFERLAASISDRIRNGDLRPGDRLPAEAALAREERVSRSTVREALRVLQEAGFVERTSPRIMVVRAHEEEIDMRERVREFRRHSVTFEDLHVALRTIEPALARLAAERANEADLEALEAILDRQAETLRDFGAWAQLDHEFHEAIATIGGNVPLILARGPIAWALGPAMQLFLHSEEATAAGLKFHRDILAELQLRDADGAAFVARRHVDDFRRGWEKAGLDYQRMIGSFDHHDRQGRTPSYTS